MGKILRIIGNVRRIPKRPILAAVSNAFVWGLGYLMFTRRKLLGFALLLWIFTALWSSVVLVSSPGSVGLVLGIAMVSWALLSTALGLDAHGEAKARIDRIQAERAEEETNKEEVSRGDLRLLLADMKRAQRRGGTDERAKYIDTLERMLGRR